MSVTPGPVAMPPWMANGRSSTVPGSNTVSMWPMHRSVGPPGSAPGSSPMTVSPRSWSFSCDVTVKPRIRSRSAVQRPMASTPAFV